MARSLKYTTSGQIVLRSEHDSFFLYKSLDHILFVSGIINKTIFECFFQFENLHEKMLFLVAQSLTTGALDDDSQTTEKVTSICLNAKRVSFSRIFLKIF